MRKPQTDLQKAKAIAEEARVELSRKYGRVFASDDGRAVIEDICRRICRSDLPVMNPNPMQVYDNAVRNDVANEIKRMITSKVSDGNANAD